MTAVTETLIACGWDDDEAREIAPDVLTDWEYADSEIEVKPFASNAKSVKVSRHEIAKFSISTDNDLFYVNVLVADVWYEMIKTFASEMQALQQITR